MYTAAQLITALLSGKTLEKNHGRDEDERAAREYIETLNCETDNFDRKHFFAAGWGTAYGSYVDRLLDIIINPQTWAIQGAPADTGIVPLLAKDINVDTPEGRCLMAAVCVLTDDNEVTIGGEVVTCSREHPDDILARLALLYHERMRPQVASEKEAEA